MIIHLAAGQSARLLDPHNLRAFKVLAEPALRDGGGWIEPASGAVRAHIEFGQPPA